MTTLITDPKLDFSDVLIMPKRSELSSRSQVDLTRTIEMKHCNLQYNQVPIIVANMDHTGTFEMAKALDKVGASVALHKFYTAEELISFFDSCPNPCTFYSMGITDNDFDKFEQVMQQSKLPPRFVCIDVANGYSRRFVHYVEMVREKYPNICIMAGNVVTPDMTYDLIERGADIVKIGIGSGSVCTTRRITGVGYPQLSAILECADAAHGIGGQVCSDGGIIYPGDFSKAFAAGADFVMGGGIFSGHDQCTGDVYGKEETGFYKLFYGMSSQTAMDKHYGGKADYRASEGKVVNVPYKGDIAHTIEEILGGIRSCCTYVGANQLKHLPKCATLVQVNRQLNESLTQYNA